jgi:D-alanyl-D-alanine dipeptidase
MQLLFITSGAKIRVPFETRRMTAISETAKQAAKRLKQQRGEASGRAYALKMRDQYKPNEPEYQYWNFVATLIQGAPQQSPEMRVAILEAHIEGMRAALGIGRYKDDARCPYEVGTPEQEAWAAGLKEVLHGEVQ